MGGSGRLWVRMMDTPVSESGLAVRSSIPARYTREIRARERLHECCPIDVYVAGINDRYSWPYRLMSAKEARPGVRETCETLIVDSVVNDPYYPMEAVLDVAHRVGADYVVGKDWPAFADPAGEGIHSLTAYEHFVGRYQRHECDAELIVPLQPPFDAQTIRSLCDSGVAQFALGGLRDLPGAEQVHHIRAFREHAGFDVHAHGLGVGTATELLAALRASIATDSTRPLLDSLDLSTPETAVRNNRLPDKHWHQHRSPLPSGTDSTTVRAGFAEAIARMLEYELTLECTDEAVAGASRSGDLGLVG